MATIDIRRSHSISKDDAKKLAEQLAVSMQQKLDLDWRWDGDRIAFEATRGSAKGTKGSVDVTDKDVRVQIDLPMMLRMMKGMVESRVEEKLKQLF
jgi:putative polyhydroxyalkanoate system protein